MAQTREKDEKTKSSDSKKFVKAYECAICTHSNYAHGDYTGPCLENCDCTGFARDARVTEIRPPKVEPEVSEKLDEIIGLLEKIAAK